MKRFHSFLWLFCIFLLSRSKLEWMAFGCGFKREKKPKLCTWKSVSVHTCRRSLMWTRSGPYMLFLLMIREIFRYVSSSSGAMNAKSEKEGYWWGSEMRPNFDINTSRKKEVREELTIINWGLQPDQPVTTPRLGHKSPWIDLQAVAMIITDNAERRAMKKSCWSASHNRSNPIR